MISYSDAIQTLQTVPRTNAALELLIMAMADAHNAAGRRTWLGKDKGQIAYDKFKESFKHLLYEMYEEHLLEIGDTNAQVVEMVKDAMQTFQAVYPNWPEAYRFADRLLDVRNTGLVAAMINDVREFREYLDIPRILRSQPRRQ